MADQILRTKNIGFRVLRKTKAGTTDLVVFQSTTYRNIRAYGTIDQNTTGYAHLEFSVSASDCVITTLNDTAINPTQGCGFISFDYEDSLSNNCSIAMIVTDFVQESASPDYKFWVNGWTGVQKLPPLV